MDSLARNALRISLAGAGAAAVLGAGLAGQASAAETPELPALPGAPDVSGQDLGSGTTELEGAFSELQVPSTDTLTSSVPFSVPSSQSSAQQAATTLPSSGLPSADSLPGADELPALDIPGVMYIEAPTVTF